MASSEVSSQTDGAWPQVQSGPLMTGGILVGIGAVVASAGLAVIGFHLFSATRQWASELETPPNEFARLKWQQAKAAAASGVSTWQDHPHAKVRLARRSSS